jgi:DNA-binding transcriptional ArsR family regulator
MRPVQENDVFHAIAHPARRAILVTLKDGERAASALAEPFRMTFAAISQHLRVLRDVVSWADEFATFFAQRLDALGSYLDRKHGKRR